MRQRLRRHARFVLIFLIGADSRTCTLPIALDKHVHHKSGRAIMSRCRVLSVLLKILPTIASLRGTPSCDIQINLLRV
jgi:hypothetical protein